MMSTPYQEALEWINHHPGNDTAMGMVKLLLSLADNSNAFSMRECTAGMDEFGLAVALRVVSHYVRIGDENDPNLQEVAQILVERYPRMGEVAEAWIKVRQDLIEKWRVEDDGDCV